MVVERTGKQVLPGCYSFGSIDGVSERGHIIATVNYEQFGPFRGVLWTRRH